LLGKAHPEAGLHAFRVRSKPLALLRPLVELLRWGGSDSTVFVRSADGVYLSDTPGDRTFDLCVSGYGPFIPETIAGHARPFLFLDIGANLGLFSLLAARHPLCRGVVAFEPLPAIFAHLRRNIARNGARKVKAVCAALSDSGSRTLYMAFDPRHSGMSKVVDRKRRGTLRVRAIGVASLAQLVRDWPDSVMAKIDVEGEEPAVLSMLRRAPFYASLGDLIVEVSDRNLGSQKKRELLDLLAADGFVEVARSGPDDHYDAHFRRPPGSTQGGARSYR
jgi:FkbM family methyltransferase